MNQPPQYLENVTIGMVTVLLIIAVLIGMQVFGVLKSLLKKTQKPL